MEKLNQILNVIMGAFVGVFIGHTIYVIWNFKTHPQLYIAYSAPWYTSILVYGVFTLIILLICITIKVVMNYKDKKKE